jgi:ribonuclease VapC
VPLSVAQGRLAREAYRRFGRGTGHPAQLDLGDCFAYALARDLGEPLLFKGVDFALTDIELVTEPVRERRMSETVARYATSAGS